MERAERKRRKRKRKNTVASGAPVSFDPGENESESRDSHANLGRGTLRSSDSEIRFARMRLAQPSRGTVDGEV